jgi:hypothetical protein
MGQNGIQPDQADVLAYLGPLQRCDLLFSKSLADDMRP